MTEFADELMIQFFDGSEIIQDTTQFSKLNKAARMHLDLTTQKGSNILNILTTSDKCEIGSDTYQILDRTFMLNGTALYITVKNLKSKNDEFK